MLDMLESRTAIYNSVPRLLEGYSQAAAQPSILCVQHSSRRGKCCGCPCSNVLWCPIITASSSLHPMQLRYVFVPVHLWSPTGLSSMSKNSALLLARYCIVAAKNRDVSTSKDCSECVSTKPGPIAFSRRTPRLIGVRLASSRTDRCRCEYHVRCTAGRCKGGAVQRDTRANWDGRQKEMESTTWRTYKNSRVRRSSWPLCFAGCYCTLCLLL